MFLICRASLANQKQHQDLGSDALVLRRHFTGKPVVDFLIFVFIPIFAKTLIDVRLFKMKNRLFGK